uniref:Uncharacterized protein n=1 Tax=Calcidiscus leptoporus TaxID=127549 RepID=A0A7S0JLZ4_9EUKA|mmetsp:Transcript_9212/g.21378  ORF Transcript_9212/g.21378 Transcript_9212/m.21378 type:complete len:525 (+) Transcript_9212:87-1661(+)|eukprot:CAMPEP_0119370292 /NCGR_PEP_ID=MMETSP1334-20130426/16671_1 /TAXON_ID=127549 /ORGANISM="Calcidiscus leptoporus, Strain RCC1130" /LENGTH=524 /DNA_ID=CAMNT_0007387337 /DNA_START=78 /DNA_END=1652 /DNA_ORIENTATION=-
MSIVGTEAYPQDICSGGGEMKNLWASQRNNKGAASPLLHSRGGCKGKTQDCSLALSPPLGSVSLKCLPLLEARIVAWIGGPPASGKSTLALRAAQYGFLSADCEPPSSGPDWLSGFGAVGMTNRVLALANASSWLLGATTSGMVVGSCYGEWMPSSPAHIMRVLLLPEQGVYQQRHQQRGSTGWSTDGWRHAYRQYRNSLLVWQRDNGTSIIRIQDRPNETSCPDKTLFDACEGIMAHLDKTPHELCFYCRRTRPPQSAFWLRCPPECLGREGGERGGAGHASHEGASFPGASSPRADSDHSSKVATPAEMEEIKQLLLATQGGRLDRSATHNWRNPSVPGRYGYHSIQIGNVNLVGQRNPNERLNILRSFLNFTGKVVVDLGCNVGGMLHHLAEVKHAYGFEFDPRCVKAATRIAEIFHLPEHFYQANLNTFDPNSTFRGLEHAPDIVFVFNIGSWVGQWQQLYQAIANTGVPMIVLETNNDKEGAPQLRTFRDMGRKVQFISQAKDDVTGNFRRKTYLVTPA